MTAVPIQVGIHRYGEGKGATYKVISCTAMAYMQGKGDDGAHGVTSYIVMAYTTARARAVPWGLLWLVRLDGR